MEVTSVRVWPIENGGSLKATANVVIAGDGGDISINRLKVVKRKDGRVFVSLPNESYPKNGKVHYVEIISLPSRLMKDIEALVFKELGL